jgi:hypothetical protein
MAQKITIRESGFIGYNDTDTPEFLPDGMLSDALNCFMRTGDIVKRTGYTIVGSTIGNYSCQGFRAVQFAGGTQELISVFNGIVYKSTGGVLSAIAGAYTLSTTGYIDVVVANDGVYFFDGINTVPKYNGAAMSTVATIPIGKYAKWLFNQLHVAGMSAIPNTVRSSNAGDPEDFTGGITSTIAVNPNDGDRITALGVINRELLVYKRNRIWSLTGFGTALTVSDINERTSGVGTLSHWSLVNVGDDILYLGYLGDVPVIRSLKKTSQSTLIDGGVVSTDIEGTLGNLNKSQLSLTTSIFDGRYAWFSVPNLTDTNNSLILTLDSETLGKKHKGWSRHTGIYATHFDTSTVSGAAVIYFGDSRNNGKIYKLDNSTSDNGTAINFQIKTRRYGGETPELKKKYKWLYITARETGNYDVTIDYAKDGFDFENLGTLNLSGTGSQFDNIILDTSRLGSTDVNKERYTIPKSRNYYMQFKFYDTSAVSSITIRDWEIYFYKKGPTDPL